MATALLRRTCETAQALLLYDFCLASLLDLRRAQIPQHLENPRFPDRWFSVAQGAPCDRKVFHGPRNPPPRVSPLEESITPFAAYNIQHVSGAAVLPICLAFLYRYQRPHSGRCLKKSLARKYLAFQRFRWRLW